MTLRTDQTAAPVPEGYFLNARGAVVPERYRSDKDDIRDQVVADLVGRCEAISAELSDAKARIFADLVAHVQLVAETWGVALDGRRGNVVLIDTTGTRRIERVVRPRMRVGPEVLAAEALVGELLDALTADADPTLRALVRAMFRRDDTGSISPSRLLEFVRLDLPDERWKRAQEAVRHALESDGESVYFRAYTRTDSTQPWRQVVLDFSRAPFRLPEEAAA